MKKGFCGVLLAALLLNTAVFGLTVDNDAELPTLIFGSRPFTDVNQNDWYYDGVMFAYNNGILHGTADGIFSPDESLTREQLAVMLANYARQSGKALNGAAELSAFADAAEVSDWAKDAVAAMVGAGVLGGNESGMLCASNNATRAETAVMLSRFFK